MQLRTTVIRRFEDSTPAQAGIYAEWAYIPWTPGEMHERQARFAAMKKIEPSSRTATWALGLHPEKQTFPEIDGGLKVACSQIDEQQPFTRTAIASQ